MDSKYRSLLMRSNRLLGAQLVEHNLVKLDDLEAANEKLFDLIGSGTPRQRTVLGLLAYDLGVLKEEDVLLHQRDHDGVGLIELQHYDINLELKAGLNLDECWATWSIPFDVMEDITMVATAYYLSPAVRKFWEERFDNRVLWYGTTLEGIAEFLESYEPVADPGKTEATPETSTS